MASPGLTAGRPHADAGPDAEGVALRVFLCLLLFSNLFGRVIGVNVNLLFYLAFMVVLVPSLVHFPPDLLMRVTTLAATLFLLYVLDFRSAPFANLLAVKDFVLPILCIPIGYRLFDHRAKVLRSLAVLFLPFVAYGVVQEWSFYAGVLEQLLPWDAAWVAESFLPALRG